MFVNFNNQYKFMKYKHRTKGKNQVIAKPVLNSEFQDVFIYKIIDKQSKLQSLLCIGLNDHLQIMVVRFKKQIEQFSVFQQNMEKIKSIKVASFKEFRQLPVVLKLKYSNFKDLIKYITSNREIRFQTNTQKAGAKTQQTVLSFEVPTISNKKKKVDISLTTLKKNQIDTFCSQKYALFKRIFRKAFLYAKQSKFPLPNSNENIDQNIETQNVEIDQVIATEQNKRNTFCQKFQKLKSLIQSHKQTKQKKNSEESQDQVSLIQSQQAQQGQGYEQQIQRQNSWSNNHYQRNIEDQLPFPDEQKYIKDEYIQYLEMKNQKLMKKVLKQQEKIICKDIQLLDYESLIHNSGKDQNHQVLKQGKSQSQLLDQLKYVNQVEKKQLLIIIRQLLQDRQKIQSVVKQAKQLKNQSESQLIGKISGILQNKYTFDCLFKINPSFNQFMIKELKDQFPQRHSEERQNYVSKTNDNKSIIQNDKDQFNKSMINQLLIKGSIRIKDSHPTQSSFETYQLT